MQNRHSLSHLAELEVESTVDQLRRAIIFANVGKDDGEKTGGR